jgi:hypothetical protein
LAVTNTLQRIVNVAQTYIRQAPLIFPALSAPNDLVFLAGDWVRQFILSPPFAWRWNRQVNTFVTAAGTQDYTETISNFGWMERASLTDATQSPNIVTELTVQLSLGEESIQNQPLFISPRLDNNTGSITFRLSPPPDKVYTVTVTSQNAPPDFANLTDTWAPLPDYLSYLYMQGFMAKTYEYFMDERFGSSMSLFVKQLVAANGGLDETQVNIFLGPRIDLQREQNTKLQNAQNATQGRFLG